MKSLIEGMSFKDMIHILYRETIIPEIYGMLGEDATLTLIQVFGGLKVQIPSYKEIKDLKRDIDIYESLSYAQGEETVRFLAKKYEVTETWVQSIYKKMHREYPKIKASLEEFRNPETVRITTRRNAVYEQNQHQS